MKRITYAFALALLIFTILTFFKDDKSDAIESYLDTSNPFSFKTSYEPTTVQGIMLGGREKWTVTSTKDKERLRSILNIGKDSEYSNGFVRVVILDGDDLYLIDMSGTLQKNGGKAIQIDTNEFVRFQQSLDSSQRKVRNTEMK